MATTALWSHRLPQTPAEDIEVTLFRQILMVPFAIEAVGASHSSAQTLKGMVEHALRTDPERRWERLAEPLFHLPEDRVPTGIDRDERARRLAPAYEEFVYFEPYVQEFLFGTADRAAPLSIWRCTALDGASLEIDHDRNEPAADTSLSVPPETDISTYRFAVDRCNLYLFPTNTALLAFELRLTGQHHRGQAARTSLADTLRLLESVRRMFPPYFVARGWRHGDPKAPLEARYFARRVATFDREGRPLWQGSYRVDTTATIESVVGGAGGIVRKAVPLFGPWRELLRPLTLEVLDQVAKGSVALTQLGDDRAFVMAQVGVRDPLAISPADWVRLCFLDTPDKGLPYARHFLDDFEQQHCYDRFFSKTPHDWQTTRYLVCAYALVAVGKTPAESEPGYVECFFRHVLTRHMRRQYFDLALIALLQKTALKTLSDRIAGAERSGPETAIAMQRQVLDFTHRYWFEDISAQLQGHELFELLRRHLRLRALYEQIAQEAREANALAAQEKQQRLGKAAQSLNIIAAVGLAASVIVGFFGMNVFVEVPFMTASRDFFVGLSLLMAGGFATLFLCREYLIKWFASGRTARFALAFVALVIGGIIFFARHS